MIAVSPKRSRTCSIGTPSSSAATWASVVSWPCPCGICWVNTETVPSASSTERAGSPAMSPPPPPAMIDSWKSGGPGRRLDERGEAERRGTGPRRAPQPDVRGPVVEVGDLERALERRARRHAHVERRSGQHLPRQLVGPDDVAQPDLVAADAEVARGEVEHALAHPRLDRPRPAVRDVRRLVRRGRASYVKPSAAMPVRPRQHHPDHHRVHRGAERERRVRALVHRHVHAHAEQRAVVAERRFDVERLLARLAGDEQVLVAVLDPLHRPAEIDGGGEHGDVLTRREHLHAERAADVLRGDPGQRDRVAGQQPEQRSASGARCASARAGTSAPSPCPATPAPTALRRWAPRPRRAWRRPRRPDALLAARHRLGLLQQARHALALAGDLDQRLPHRSAPGERGQRPLHDDGVFCVAAWYRTVPATASTSATHPRVSIGWLE